MKKFITGGVTNEYLYNLFGQEIEYRFYNCGNSKIVYKRDNYIYNEKKQLSSYIDHQFGDYNYKYVINYDNTNRVNEEKMYPLKGSILVEDSWLVDWITYEYGNNYRITTSLIGGEWKEWQTIDITDGQNIINKFEIRFLSYKIDTTEYLYEYDNKLNPQPELGYKKNNITKVLVKNEHGNWEIESAYLYGYNDKDYPVKRTNLLNYAVDLYEYY
ncbi:MAG: hypothetical protein K9I36_07900 [Bacteroidia bacterium]|nr:hypothetical protein [Bacteroidia bacterium]MCF8426639.1 hypothetical protein [Bacteroidia bacterium]